MTYFLKKKKWMAWVVLLTFLFTSFMPSNILAGNSVAEAAGYSATINPTLEHAECAYIYFQNETGANTNSLTSVTGSSTIQDFASTSANGWNSHPGYIVFFVKPEAGYLLTGLGSNGNGDIYALSGSEFGNISGYPGLSSAVARAKEAGYIACFGYSRAAGGGAVNAEFQVTGVKPAIKVTAVSNKVADIVPGDGLTITVTITPDTSVNGKTLAVDSMTVTSVTINGISYQIDNLMNNGDGTYSGTVSYAATEADCNAGKITVSADASVEYSYSLGVSDSTGVTGEANTQVTITNTGTTECTIAAKKGVNYQYNYVDADSNAIGLRPTGVNGAPTDRTEYYPGAEVTVQETPIPTDSVNNIWSDETHNGYWTFDGWYLNGVLVKDLQVQMSGNGLYFTGIWTFHPYIEITIKADNAERAYNGNPLICSTASVTEGELSAGDEIKATMTANSTITNPGTQPNVIDTVKIVDGNKKDVTYRYKIKTKPGTLTVKPLKMNVSATSYEGIYDGNAHSIGVTVTENGEDVTGQFTICYATTNPESGNVTWVKENPAYTDVYWDMDKNNVESHTVWYQVSCKGYEPVTGSKTVTITPRPITITINDAEKQYGKVDPAFTGGITNGELVAVGDLGTITYSRTNTDEAVGQYEDVLTATYTENSNYDVTVIPGDFEITTNTEDLTVTGIPYSGVYDGENHAVSATASIAGAVVEYEVDGEWMTTAPSATNVTEETTYNVRARLEGYQTASTTVKLEITPKPVIITVDNASKTVGEVDPDFTGSVDGLVDNADLGEVTYSRINNAETVGTYEDVLTANYTENGNYDVTVIPGDFAITHNEATEYTVNYYYQNPDKAPNPSEEGSYFKLDEKVRTTTSGAIAFLLDEDIVPKLDNYQFNVAKSDVQKMVKADGSTVLNVYFDALYNVVYRYTDGETSYDVASSGYVYHYGDKVVAPGMASVDQFDGKWCKNADGSTDEWVFADETIGGNIGLMDLATNTIYLYTTAKVTPLKENTIRIKKETVNGTAGAEYGFNLKLLVNAPTETNPLTGTAAEQLHSYNAAMITAKGQYDSAQDALDKAKAAFVNSGMATTQSAYSYIMYGNGVEDITGNNILPALYAITTGSAYEFRAYNLFENSFDVRNGAETADEGVMQQIADFIESMVNWRTPFQTLDPEATLEGLNWSGINTSGSALAFDFDKVSDLFIAAKDLVGKEQAYQDAKADLDNYMEKVGRYAMVTVNGERYVLNGTDEEGNKLFTQDENGNYILNFDFDLASGTSKDFTVTATTGSTIQFIITETADGGAVSTTVNGISGNSVSGVLTTGSALEYTFVNTFNGGGGNGNGGNGNGGDGGYDGPYSDDPSDDDTIINDPNVPLTEPDVDDTDDGIAIDDGDVPLTDVPGEAVEIGEPQVPLGDAPKTGDANNAIPFVVLMMMAGLGLVVTRRKFN